MGTLIDASVFIAVERGQLDPARLAGAAIGDADLMITATAVWLDYRVATRDLRSFPRIPGLDVVPW